MVACKCWSWTEPNRHRKPRGMIRAGRKESAVEVRDAVQAGKQYLANVFADEDISNTRLEEVEYSNADEAWKVTFSFLRPTGTLSSMEVVTGAHLKPGRNVKRDYKVVTIDNQSGQATSVKHRALDAAE